MTLRVKLEIVPFGDEDRAYEIGRLDIFNKGSNELTPGICDYGVIELTPTSGGLHAKDVAHIRNMGAWELVRNVLAALPIHGPMS